VESFLVQKSNKKDKLTKIQRRNLQSMIVLSVVATTLLGISSTFLYKYKEYGKTSMEQASKIEDNIYSAEREINALTAVKSKIEIPMYVKDESAELTFLKHIAILTNTVGKNNVQTVEPKFKEAKSDENFNYIPIGISFELTDMPLNEIFKQFKDVYPEPKFENLNVSYKEKKVLASLDLVSISLKNDKDKNDSIDKIAEKFSSINFKNSIFGAIVDYSEKLKPGGAQTGGGNSGGGITIGDPQGGNTTTTPNVEKPSIGDTSSKGIHTNSPLKSNFNITSPYGDRVHPISGEKEFHNGVDLSADIGTPIYATCDGTIEFSGNKGNNGNMITLKGVDSKGQEIKVFYLHLSALDVKEGQKVTKGLALGKTGNTGLTTGPHLHYGIQVSGKYVDPMSFTW
jgi:murein DD-endopeptidase MepM/ murein hydrolase activator NlpD